MRKQHRHLTVTEADELMEPEKDERPIEEQVGELKEIARGLLERLRTSQDQNVQAAIDNLNRAIEIDSRKVVAGLLAQLDILAAHHSSNDDTAAGIAKLKAALAAETDTALQERLLLVGIRNLNVTPEEGSDLAGKIAKSKAVIGKDESRRSNLTDAISNILAFEQGSEGRDIQAALVNMGNAGKKFEAHFVPGVTAFTFPATWYQSVNACGIVIFAPIFAFVWIFLAARGLEPSTPYKFALGLILVSASFFVMIPGAIEAKETAGKANPHWLILCYLLATWGELCLSPVGLSMVTKLAPARFASLAMGVWFMASSVAYILAGYAASYFGSGEGVSLFFGPEKGLADFFLLMAVFPMVIGFIALAMASKLKKMMHGAG